jgi:transglutaminase-like putative cysteine protease
VPVPPLTEGASAHLAFYAQELQAGAVAYARDVFPLDLAGQADLRLLLALVVYATVGAAAFLGLSLRRPLPAIVILLVLAGFGFTTDESARDAWAALTFVLLAGGMLAGSRSLKRERLRATDALAGGATAVLAAVLALSILGTTAVEAGRPLKDWRQWDILGAGNAKFSFDLMQNYPRLLDPAEDELVMRVRSAVPSYWRASILGEFDGSIWRGGVPDGSELQPALRDGQWIYDVPPAQPAPQGRPITQQFEIVSTYTDRLFAGGWATQVRASLPLDLRMTDATAIAVSPARGPELDYALTAVVPDLEPTDLIGRGRYYPEDVMRDSLGLPFPARPQTGGPEAADEWRAAAAALPAGREWVELYALNERIVGAETDPYRVALAVEQALRTGYDYSLRPPDAGFDSPYAEFLFSTRVGYCQHFAGAMATLLRFNGIPARVVVGFTTGDEESLGIWAVSRNDAHSWVEAYFPGVGWAQFDPTPGRQIPSTGDAPVNGPDAAAAAGIDAGASPGTPDNAREAGEGRVADPGGPGAESVETAPSQAGSRLPWALAILALVVIWPAGRALLRRRGLRRGSKEERLSASVALLYADLRDHGVEAPASQTLDETAGYLDQRLGVDAGDLPARVQAVEFGGRPASAADLEDLAALRRRVRRQLHRREGWPTAALALYGIRPPSARRGPATPGRRVPRRI